MSFGHAKKPKGTIVVIILGLISVMLFFALSLSRRISGQSQLLTVADSTQIARFFLESYSGDVLHQLKKQLSDPSSKVSELIRTSNGKTDIPIADFYKKSSDLVDELAKEFSIKKEDPKISLNQSSLLKYPAILAVPNTYTERKGTLSIQCQAGFANRKYKVHMTFPYKVVYTMNPLLKDFVLYCDQIAKEQTWKDNSNLEDNINVLYTKDSDSPVYDNSSKNGGKPWVINTNYLNDPVKNGNIFLGPDDQSICLNLAGETKNRLDFTWSAGTTSNVDKGAMCDLWLVEPKYFKSAEKRFDERGECFIDKSGDPIGLRGLKLQTQVEDNDAYLYLVGFCSEISVDSGGYFSNTDRRLKDFLPEDPVFKNYYSRSPDTRKKMALSSSLKLFGLNPEIAPDGKSMTPDTMLDPMKRSRKIYGKVFSRFILLSFFKPVSGVGAVQEIPYSESPGATLDDFSKFDGSTVKFQPKYPYQIYMSRIVSGGHPSQSDQSNWLSMYQPPNPGTNPPMNNVLDATKFEAPDGLKLDKTKTPCQFAKFAPGWVPILKKETESAKIQAQKEIFNGSLYSRITHYFPNQDAFKSYALTKAPDGSNLFRLGGVVLVSGDVTLPPITLPSNQISGGILIATGTINIGEVTRGLDPQNAKSVFDAMQKLPQTQFLSFVSLKSIGGSGDKSIVLKGNNFFGIQVVALSPESIAPTQMIVFEPSSSKDTIMFFGGIAVSTPSMKDQVKTIAGSGYMEMPTGITYVPSMAAANASTTVSIPPGVTGYDFSVE